MTRSRSSHGGGGSGAIGDVFRRQAAHFELLGSPVYARLAERLALDPAPAVAVVGDDVSWDLGLRLFGAVHHLVLTGVAPDALSGDYADFTSALAEHHGSVARFVREQGVQTNETQRCVALVPAFLTVARDTWLPLDLIELGPSAGLNLVFDRYRYSYAQGRWGDPAADLAFTADERGEVPADVLATPLVVRRRRGIDLNPIDVTTRDGVLLLHAFLWPGRADRAERLDAAIATLLAAPQRPELVRGDYVDLLPGLLAERPEDAVTVVFQTASTGYLSRARYDELKAALEAAAADGRPLAWVSSRRSDEREGRDDDGYELEIRVWPGPARLAAHVDFHGNWIDWQDAPAGRGRVAEPAVTPRRIGAGGT